MISVCLSPRICRTLLTSFEATDIIRRRLSARWWFTHLNARHQGEDSYQAIDRRRGEVIGHTLEWLTTHCEGPFFIWVHLYDAHDPYDPPEPYKTKYASAPYDGELGH